MRERAELARERYAEAREEGLGRVGAGLVALRAAVEQDRERARERGAEPEDLRERLRALLGRQGEREVERRARPRVGAWSQSAQGRAGAGACRRSPEDGRSLTERLRAALDGARSGPPGRELRTEQEERPGRAGAAAGDGAGAEPGAGAGRRAGAVTAAAPLGEHQQVLLSVCEEQAVYHDLALQDLSTYLETPNHNGFAYTRL